MADLGHPEQKLPPVLHVAGSKGKGSTVAMLRSVLEAAGYSVHAYISPHLVRFAERIRLNGKLIDESYLAELLEEVERVNAGRPITFFEVTTAAAFLAYARNPADAVILEVGMGGRLDATNIVAKPLASTLVPISFDHMQYLGDTLAKIAMEKAGILKQGVPVVSGLQPDEALKVIEARAAEIGAPLFRRGHEWRATPTTTGFRYEGQRTLDLPLPSLPGRHQIDNAALAVATLDCIGTFKISDAQFRAGLSQIDWPARLQRLSRGPLVTLLPKTTELWLDGGHNEAAGRVLADWAADTKRPLDLVVGMLSTKEPERFLAPLAPYAQRLRAIAIPNEPLSLPAEVVAEAGRRAGFKDVVASASAAEAVADLARHNPARVMITGSLYLAGSILAENN